MRRLVCLALIAAALCAGAREPLEGEWRVNGGGPVLLFRQSDSGDGHLDIVWRGGDGPVSDGTVVGRAVASPEPGVYDCIGLDPRSEKGCKSRKPATTEFVIRMDKEYGHTLTFEPYERSKSIDVYRFMPWWLRVRVKTKDTRPGGLDGARRTDAPPQFIVL